MKILALVGLPGSGKSHYINKLESLDKYLIIDDPKNADDLPDIATAKNFDIIIADCHLCIPRIREKFINKMNKTYPDHSIEFLFFENNPSQCLKNVNYRNDGRKVETTIIQYSKEYEIPVNSNIIPVFNTDLLIKNKNKFKP